MLSRSIDEVLGVMADVRAGGEVLGAAEQDQLIGILRSWRLAALNLESGRAARPRPGRTGFRPAVVGGTDLTSKRKGASA